MNERIIVLTGATDGLGLALATELAAAEDATLILHGRNQNRLDELCAALTGTPARLHPVRADLADLAQVRRLAEEIAGITDRVNVLVNNAGIGSGGPDGAQRTLTVDGHELRFAVNHLAAFDLTRRLLPLLERGAPARIVNVASMGQAAVDFDDPRMDAGYTSQRAYWQSKLAMITTGFELAGRLDPQRVTVNSLHPATWMPTKLVLHDGGQTKDTLETGVAATMRLIQDPELAGVSGEFFDRTEPVRAKEEAYDPQYRRRMWELSVRATQG